MDMDYGFHATPFGECLIGVTKRGVCWFSFQAAEEKHQALEELKQAWPGARVRENASLTQSYVTRIFAPMWITADKPIHLLLKGTNFRIKVWEALLRIPAGRLASYEAIATRIGNVKAVRAVATACASNTIGYLIPCHRVLRKAGQIWGTAGIPAGKKQC